MPMKTVNLSVERTDSRGAPCDAHGKGDDGPKAAWTIYLGKMRYPILLCERCHSEAGL